MESCFRRWERRAVHIHPPVPAAIRITYFEILRYILSLAGDDACYMFSAVLYLLLREQGIRAELFLGKISDGRGRTDHAWVEIDGKVYDPAISEKEIEGRGFGPVLAGIDLDTGRKSGLVYGLPTCRHGAFARSIRQTSFDDYINDHPYHPKGLGRLMVEIGRRIGVQPRLDKIGTEYANTVWKEKAAA